MLYVLIGLLQPTSGTVTYDGEPLDAYDKEALHRQVGFVFQDSVLFNLTLRENIAFSEAISDRGSWTGRSPRPSSTILSGPCRRGSTRWSRSAEPAFPAGRSSA